ncbi:MAG: branched-chain amino acid ABC transporter substrate-binding protein [Holophaga sp.]
MRKVTNVLAPTVALFCLLLAGCGKEAKTVKIAVQMPLSGPLSVFGVSQKNSAQLAVEQLSEPLKNLGFKVELAAYDDQANPDTGVANAKAIIGDPSIMGVVAHWNSGVYIPSSEVYHTVDLAAISPGTSNPKVTDRGLSDVNRVCGRDDVQGAVGAAFAKDQGFKSVYVLHDKQTYGQGIAEFFKKECETAGIRVAGFAGTEEKANFDAILSPILAAKPDCLYFGGQFDQGAVLFRQARQKGFKGVFLSDDAFDSPDAAKIGGEFLSQGGGCYFSTLSGPASIYPDAAKFITDYKAKFASDPQPYCPQAYDSTAILLTAVENAIKANNGKLPERGEVSKAVRALKDYKGLSGTLNFNSKGDPVVSRYFIVQVTAKDSGQWDNNKILKSLNIKAP